MGSEEIKNLGNREGWGFVGVYGQKVFGEQRGAKVRAAMVLSFSKPIKEKVKKPAKVEGGSRFEVHSAGFTVGNFAKIMINNEDVPTCKHKDNYCRGLNVVVADPFTHKVLHAKSYDTFASAKASAAFLADAKDFPEGAIVLAAVKDEASKNLSGKAKAFFSKLGSQHVNALAYRNSWAFIGVMGQQAYTEERSATDAIGTGAILGYAKKVTHTKKVTKITGGSKIEAHSAGFLHGNYARVLINEKEVFTNKDAGRGINIVALDFENHKVVFKGSYDTYADPNASVKMIADFKDKLPQYCIVVAAAKDEASSKLSKEVKGLFRDLGSKNISNLKFREGWAFIGVRGVKKSTEKRGNTAGVAMVIGYGKITKKEVRKEVRTKVEPVKGGSRIEVQSAGFKHGNFATINIQGQMIVNHDSGKRGLNVVALEPFKHELILN